MYVCLCYGVSDKKIKKMVDQGTNTMKTIKMHAVQALIVGFVFESFNLSYLNPKSQLVADIMLSIDKQAYFL